MDLDKAGFPMSTLVFYQRSHHLCNCASVRENPKTRRVDNPGTKGDGFVIEFAAELFGRQPMKIDG